MHEIISSKIINVNSNHNLEQKLKTYLRSPAVWLSRSTLIPVEKFWNWTDFRFIIGVFFTAVVLLVECRSFNTADRPERLVDTALKEGFLFPKLNDISLSILRFDFVKVAVFFLSFRTCFSVGVFNASTGLLPYKTLVCVHLWLT